MKEKYRKELAEAKEAAYNDAGSSKATNLAVENAEIVDLPVKRRTKNEGYTNPGQGVTGRAAGPTG